MVAASIVVMVAAALGACAREPVAPTGQARAVTAPGGRAAMAPEVSVSALLDSFAIGGVYTVLPRGEYYGGMAYSPSPRKELYAGSVGGHPTGLALPVGLPVRILAEGIVVSRSTTAFQREECSLPWRATDPICSISSFTYTVHGLAPGPGVLRPYEPGMGLALTWSRTAGYYDRFFGVHPVAEFFRGRVPAADTATVRELHFRRNGCCYDFSWRATEAWETYEGVWRFGAVPDDGGQAELGVQAVLRLRGPRTDAPQAAPADFTVETTAGDSIVTTRWWYVRPANNSFDGERVDSVAPGTQYPPYVPRYPDARRAAFTELAACLGRRTCAYQAPAAGALVVQATLADGRVLAARNTGASGAHVKITADTTTLTYGDTTVFRVTAAGASQWSVTGYSFRPVGAVLASAVQAVLGPVAGRGARSAATMSPEGVRVVRGRPSARFRDAALACSEATIAVCYHDPPQTGYEVVTAVVDGEAQRDSVLVRVVPVLRVWCTPAAVVRAERVTCTAAMSDSSVFTPKHRYSATNGDVLVDEEILPDTAVSSFIWEGLAIVPTRVEIFGLHRQSPISGRGSFAVIARSGPEWSRLRVPSTAPTPEYVAGPPLRQNPFPIARSLWAEDGAIGLYDRGEFSRWGVVVAGPNANLVYALAPLAVGSPRIFVHAWLLRGSKFYNAQHGNTNVFGLAPCSGSDIDRLRNNVIEHEIRHHSADVAFFVNNDVQELFEAASARFDIQQLGDTEKLEAARSAASDAAFGSAWKASVVTAVHRDSVATPSCRRLDP